MEEEKKEKEEEEEERREAGTKEEEVSPPQCPYFSLRVYDLVFPLIVNAGTPLNHTLVTNTLTQKALQSCIKMDADNSTF